MGQFLKNNFESEVDSLNLLRKQKHWLHFVNLMNFYQDLLRSTHLAMARNPLNFALLHFFGGSQLNLVKGVKNVIGGNLSDSSVYVRRTIEGFRYSLFLRENPGIAGAWFEPDKKKKFEGTFKEWFKKVGKELSETEFYRSNAHFKHASNFGPHANAQLFSLQQEFLRLPDKIEYRILYTELDDGEPGYSNLIGTYFWHATIHARAIDWWIRKSNFLTKPSPDQLKYWDESYRSLKKTEALARAFVGRSLKAHGHEVPKDS